MGSTIKQGLSPNNSNSITPQQGKEGKKKGSEERKDETPNQSKEDLTNESELEFTRLEEHRSEAQLPTKGEIMAMFTRLENSIKTEINILRSDLGHLLTRLEMVEDTLDKQAREIRTSKDQVKNLQHNQAKFLYRLEDQENRNRRQNLRIRSVPERRGEDLRKVIGEIFSPILGTEAEDFPNI